MKILYVDNFRGFSNTYIPLKDVNFLVGENSTGKTSILSLLKLMSTPDFWFDYDFNSNEIKFGHFADIVSISASEQNYFNIGFIELVVDEEDENKNQINSFLMTFSNKGGIPRPSAYFCSFGSNEIRVKLKGNKIKFKQRLISIFNQIDEFISNIYIEWVAVCKSDKKGYKQLPSELRDFHSTPVAIIASILDQILVKESRHAKPGRVIIPFTTSEIVWIAPIRTKPRRTYDEYKLEFSSEGTHTPYVIKKYLEKKSKAEDFKKFLEAVGQNSGLFHSVIVKTYGRGATAPFELDVILSDKPLSINNVGYGVSQALPVIVEAFVVRKKAWFAIQQPEVHLHPKAQAALGDMFFNLAATEGKKFIVETHSDYAIDRFRLNYRRTDLKEKPKAQILYFERTSEGNKAYQIEIQDNGELPPDQPEGYRNFFIKAELDLLGL